MRSARGIVWLTSSEQGNVRKLALKLLTYVGDVCAAALPRALFVKPAAFSGAEMVAIGAVIVAGSVYQHRCQ